MEDLIIVNDEIKKCEFRYNAGLNQMGLYVEGASWDALVPINRINEFCALFPNINWMKGAFLSEVIGSYVRVCAESATKQIIKIMHIVQNIEYTFEKTMEQKDEE